MRNSILGFLSFLLLISAFSSCKKTESSTQQTSSTQQASSAIKSLSDSLNSMNYLPGSCPYPCTDTRCQAYLNGYCSTPPSPSPAANSNNPYDSSGIYHNLALNYSLGASTSTTTRLALVDSANQYTTYNFGSRVSNLNQLLLNLQQVNSIIADTGNNFHNIIDGSNYSSYSKSRLKAFVDGLFILADSTITYSIYKNQILSFETSIQQDSQIPSQDLPHLLAVASVARYSIYFWINLYNNPGGIARGKTKWWQWLVIGITDVAGGIAGGLTGGTSHIGIVAGAVAGAASASSGAATLVGYGQNP